MVESVILALSLSLFPPRPTPPQIQLNDASRGIDYERPVTLPGRPPSVRAAKIFVSPSRRSADLSPPCVAAAAARRTRIIDQTWRFVASAAPSVASR